jgi:hypothetical protein
MDQYAHFFVSTRADNPKLAEDEFELRIGYYDDPGLNPPGVPAGWGTAIGTIPVSRIVDRPQG